jgi:hypothetical protein
MSPIAFFDIAGNTGVAFGKPGDKPELSTHRFIRPDDGDDAIEIACGRAADCVAALIVNRNVCVVYCEKPINPAAQHRQSKRHFQASNSLALIALWGSVIGTARRYKTPCRSVAPATYRKWFIGPNWHTFEEPKKESRRLGLALGWDVKTLDEADAAAGWLYTCALFDRSIEPPLRLQAGREAVML